MNPFTEPTVAKPATGVEPSRPSRHAGASCGVRPPGPRLPTPAARPPVVPRRPRGGLSTAGRVLSALMLAGSLLLPGLAAAIDINSATPEQLQEIKGIGPKTAGIIIEERERGGRFESIADVSDRVKGIGPKKAASLQAAGLTVGMASEPASGGRGAGGAKRTR